MNGLPNPPTDNLYKFIAVAGLVLFFGAMVAGLMQERQFFEWDFQQERLLDTQFYEALRATDHEDAHDAWKDAWELFKEESKTRREYMEITSKMCVVGIVSGFFVAIFGFVMWWRKSQWYQDQLLIMEYETNRIALEKEGYRLPIRHTWATRIESAKAWSEKWIKPLIVKAKNSPEPSANLVATPPESPPATDEQSPSGTP